MAPHISIAQSLSETPMPVLTLSVFCIAAVIAYYSYPVIIFVAHEKHLMDVPGERSVHRKQVPTLGGVGIFIGFSVALTFVGFAMHSLQLVSLLGALILLFFMGMKDDLLILSPRKKFIIQFIATLQVILISDVRISSFFGLFGVDALPYWFSVAFTLFVFVLVINAYNLIDGVDGLAGSVGLAASLFFGIFFQVNQMQTLALVSFALAGVLCPFLYYNFSNTRKIFMGDTGSMLVGFLLAYQAVSFLNLQATLPTYHLSNAPVFVLAALCFPLIDTLRIFLVRFLKGQSPFTADRNHIHHRLLSLGLKHWQVTLVVFVFSIVVVAVAFLTRNLEIHQQLLTVLTFAVFLALSPFFITVKDNKVRLLSPKRLLKRAA